MYGVPGRRHRVTRLETAGRRHGPESATFSRRDGAGAADGRQPVDVEKLLDLRVSEVDDPASFWAQIGEGRCSLVPTNFVVLNCCRKLISVWWDLNLSYYVWV